MPPMRPIRTVIAAATAATFALSVPAGEQSTDFKGTGNERIVIQMADPTNAGSFDGTWMYVNHDMQFGMWIRTKNGVPQVKLQFQSLMTTEAFETDWDGKAAYYLAGSPVTFELKLGPSTTDRITGSWSWVLKAGQTGRSETANVVVYRTWDGRSLLMDFQNFEKKLTRGDQERVFKTPTVWNWIKISKRELLWDEFPF
jgi:hypothetical protein